MKKICFAILIMVFGPVYLIAQTQKNTPTAALTASQKADRQAILSMCGCYEVSFEYAETFASDTAYKLRKPYKTKGLEYIVAIEDKNDNIILQHLLVAYDTMVIKHWRQDWLYQSNDFFTFRHDKIWDYAPLKTAIKGTWTQKVYEVDDSPRYMGNASWVHIDGKHYWENTTDAPLPRREYTKRSDYNVMRRTNRHEILASGHVHKQDNAKLIRSEAGDRVLVMEAGLNQYKKTDMSRCKAAQLWWPKNQAYWQDVRAVWQQIQDKKQTIELETKIDGKFLGEKLETAQANYDKLKGAAKLELVREIIGQYVKK